MVQIQARTVISLKQKVIINTAAILSSIVCSMLFMYAMGLNPFLVYAKLFSGSLGTAYRFRETVNKAIPLTVLSLGTGIAFKMKFWNIGAEGQFYMGAFGATIIALFIPRLPGIVMIPFMMIMGLLFGALFALIPALLKIKWGASETLVTLMLNYVAQKWVAYLQYGPWRDPKGNGFPQIARFTKNAILPKLFGIHIGWVIALLLAVLIFFLMKKSRLGYEVSVIGESVETARYAGLNVSKTILIAISLSGALCGLAGMMQASAIENSLSSSMSNSMGFTAVITTWLSRLNPLLMVLVSFIFSMLLQGGSFLQNALQVPASMATILQGVIIFFVLGSEFFVRYKVVLYKNEEGKLPFKKNDEEKTEKAETTSKTESTEASK